jgi:hypothetical protein
MTVANKSFRKSSRQVVAILQAVFVTILWASSWVLIKFGLRAHLPALTFAGLRYYKTSIDKGARAVIVLRRYASPSAL